jgi:putative hemolysin
MITQLLVVAVALAFSFTCSILESVLLSVTPSYVGVLQQKRPATGRLLARMRDDIDEPLAAILTLNTIAHTVGAAVSGALALELFGSRWMAAFSMVLTLAILILSEILPKTIGATYWPQLAPGAAQFLRVLIVVLKPILVPLAWFNRLIAPRRDGAILSVSRAEFKAMADIGRREGSLNEEEWQVVTNVINLKRSRVAEVMTPRTRMVAVPLDGGVAAAKSLILTQGHTRLPVYGESLDDIIGIVLSRDVWRAEDQGETDLHRVMREPRFVPWSKPVEALIRELRQEQVNMVIVVDEFGGTAGLATLEDLIEEIVGEIRDEHEVAAIEFQRMRNGEVRIDGAMPLREAGERLGLDLPVEAYDTVGGFVFGELGRVPEPGDVVAVPGGRFRVARMDELRVAGVEFVADPDPENPSN